MVVVFSDGLFPEWGRLNSAGAVFPFGCVRLFGRVQTVGNGSTCHPIVSFCRLSLKWDMKDRETANIQSDF